MARKKTELTLEEALLRLEEITKSLELSETPLEDAMALYREGVALSVFCAEKLDGAEKEILTLQKTADEAGFALKAFN